MSRAAALSLVALCGSGCSNGGELPLTRLVVGETTLVVEVASSRHALRQGLMHRQVLAPDSGMLFVLPAPSRACFWMKDTSIALSIAFIDARGQVLNVADMEPMAQTKQCAAGLASYALEVNRGLLSRAGIRAGSAIGGLPRGA